MPRPSARRARSGAGSFSRPSPTPSGRKPPRPRSDMTEELIHTYTEDGLLLEGVRYPARADLTIVYTHGLASTVFRQPQVRVGRGLQSAGYPVVAGNNRGAALATPLLQRSGPRVLGGSWFERIEDAVTDIRAWMDVAAASGAKRIVLLGHSLGAIKAIRYAAETRDARLAGLVLASPPLRGFSRPPDPALVARASRAVDEGRAQELIDLDAAGVAFGRLNAATVLSWASVGDIAPRLRSTDHPVLAIFGTEEADIGGAGGHRSVGGQVSRGLAPALVVGGGPT